MENGVLFWFLGGVDNPPGLKNAPNQGRHPEAGGTLIKRRDGCQRYPSHVILLTIVIVSEILQFSI
jgi:hypothetical protein